MSATTAVREGAQRRTMPWALAAMARRLLAAAFFVLFSLSLADPAAAQAAAGREVIITGDRAKQQFAAGYRVHISANVADDVFAAGREVTIAGTRAHSVFAGGRTIIVKDSTVRDLFAGALSIEIDGTVEDDAMVAVCPVCPWASGRLLLGPSGRIGDDALLVAGTIEVQGTIGGNLAAVARRIVISGTINGKAHLRAKEIVIASGARLGGELVARSPTKPEIASGASVAGPVREIETEVNIPDPKDLPRTIVAIAVAAAVILLIGVFVLGTLAQIAAPGPLSRGAAGLRTELWGSIGRGLAWILLLPAVGALLFASLIGIPAAVILMAAFLVLLSLAFVTAAYAIGLWVRNRNTAIAPEPGTGGRIGWTLLGILILLVAWAVPIVGWIFALLALLGGLGALTVGLSRTTRPADRT
jgi:cytoskeletal protein CcmA (bactofilin family)